jgi:hypothetical protein
MPYEQKLTLRSEQIIDIEFLVKLAEILEKHNISVFLDDDRFTLEECQKMLVEEGISSILSMIRLQESVLPVAKSIDERDLIVKTLTSQIDSLNPLSEIIIIDPFFFSVTSAELIGYLKTLKDILGTSIPEISRIRFITKPNYDKNVKIAITEMLVMLNPNLQVITSTTKEFHDRIWIIDRNKAMFIGTSLNGIGKKYALTDYVNSQDVITIIDELNKLSLLG